MAAELNRLSCVRCKDRKVRCSRVMPACDRCKSQDAECVYPVRQKRRPHRPVGEERPVVPGDALSTILERLEKVEQHCVALPQTSPTKDIHAPSSAFTPRSAASVTAHDASSSITPSPAASTAQDGYYLGSLRPSVSTVRATPPSCATDATAVLKDAVDGVQKLRLQTYSASVVTEEIKIPPDLAKSWIRSYFAQKPTDMFLSLIDKKFVEMIPDMLSFPHVHLDSCVIIIYYGVLWRGCMISDAKDKSCGPGRWFKLIFIGCIRALPGWQREATGSITDLIAAITMARLCGESFDYEMAWQMFKQAAEYAQGLGIHNLDGEGGMMRGVHNPDISDDDRKSFWDLIQVDTFFRLMFNKPPSITGNAWKVNLPWLDPDSSRPAPGPDAATMFLVSSRVTLTLIQFFAMLEECEGDVAKMERRTKDMCREIKSMYDEWNITELAKHAEANEPDTWTVAEVALNGYTCVIFMLRKLATLDSSSPQPISTDADVPDSPIALDASRHLVDIVAGLLTRSPNPSTLASTFGAYRAYVPFAYVVSHILRCPEGEVGAYAADVESLERTARCVAEISKTERHFVPLARALQCLASEVRKKAGGG